MLRAQRHNQAITMDDVMQVADAPQSTWTSSAHALHDLFVRLLTTKVKHW